MHLNGLDLVTRIGALACCLPVGPVLTSERIVCEPKHVHSRVEIQGGSVDDTFSRLNLVCRGPNDPVMSGSQSG